jgi:hypothetical protein
MRVTIHQPTYLPYLGLLSKVAAADVFIIYDTSQYEKGSVHNRQRIRNHAGSQWLTIPMRASMKPYNEAEISYEDSAHPWHEKHWRSIEQSYKKTPFFLRYEKELSGLYRDGHPFMLGDFNMRFLRFLLREARLQRKIVFFSELKIDQTLSPSEKLAVALEKVGGSDYLAGPSAKHYLKMEPFSRRGIHVSFFEFKHPVYEQFHSRFDHQFLPNMASIDALFNLGHIPLMNEGPQQNKDAGSILSQPGTLRSRA